MYQLAKRGFTQSYTYFTWRNTKSELTRYFEDLVKTEASEFFRPNLWPNTPDILPQFLQYSGRSGFITRAILAATLSSSYGVYGPAFELMENTPKDEGGEEYLIPKNMRLRTGT
jgi:starch synthase (maltosyl-transferring)